MVAVRKDSPKARRTCDHATSKIAIDATKKLPDEGFKRPWPPLIKMDAPVKAKVEERFGW